MRFVSLLVAFCFSLNVMASTGTVQELERSLDDYHYALSVEWDQKDPAFYAAQTAEFFGKLQKLIKEEGLSQEQIMTVVENKVNNKAVIEALKLKLSLLADSSNPEAIAKVIQESSKDFYATGASWSGEIIFPVVIGLIIAGVIGYSIWWKASHKCVSYERRYVCDTYTSCYGGYYGGGYYSGGYCYGNTYTSCGYANVCTQYARK
jgi:hypothetical protein